MIFLRLAVLLGFIDYAVHGGLIGSLQNITVTGRLVCSNKSLKGIEIKLWEEDTGGPDDLLNTTRSDRKGRFSLYGEEKELTAIEPYLIITHSCDNGVINPNCTIIDEYWIPKERIGKTYNMGIVSLNIARRNHKKACRNNYTPLLTTMF